MVEAVEFLPIVIAPKLCGAPRQRPRHDVLVRLVVSHQNPDPSLASVRGKRAGLDAGRVWMRPGVGGVEDPQMQVPDLALRAAGIDEGAAGHHAVEDPKRPIVVSPAEHLGVEPAGRGRIVRSEVDEDQGVWRGHSPLLGSGQAAYSARLGVKMSRLSTGSAPTTMPQCRAFGGTTRSPPGPSRVTVSPTWKSIWPARM